MYLLDTNICIYIIKKKPLTVLKKMHSKKITEIGISVITFAELQFGVEKSLFKEKNQFALNQFLAPLEVFPFDERAAVNYATIRVNLEKVGQPIGVFDMMIAAHSLSLEAILVTNNEKEFSRVQDLKIENWS